MDCMNLQALGDSSDSEYSDSSMNDSNAEKNDQNTKENPEKYIEMNLVDLEEESSEKLKKEILYDKYKDGLKLLSKQEYNEAETLFESLLKNPLLELVCSYYDIKSNGDQADKEIEATDQELVKLKYILLKNLASINSSKRKNNSQALNYLIQAAKIDSSDLTIWFDIGENAFKLNRFLIARYAYEESLKLNSEYWPAIDNLIVLLYGLGNYSLCLQYTMNALELDKFYVNGIIIIEKIKMFNEFYYSSQIESFINLNYYSCNIDLDSYLEQLPGTLFDDLFERINYIKETYQKSFFKLNDSYEINKNSFDEIRVSNKISSWHSLGNFILKVKESNQFSFYSSLKISRENDETIQFSSKNNQEKNVSSNIDNSIILGVSSTNKNVKRKKFDSTSDDSWLKRRSLRKGNEKYEQNETFISDILRKYFDESYLNDITKISNLSQKSSTNENSKLHLKLIKENEKLEIASILDEYKSGICIYDMIKNYLRLFSLSYDQLWYSELDEIYLSLFESLNKYSNLFQQLEKEQEYFEILTLCSIILVYLEIQFSKFKELQKIRQRQQKVKEIINLTNEKLENENFQILIYKLNKLEYYLEKICLNNQDFNFDEVFLEASKTFIIRSACLGLFASFYEDSISSDFYIHRIKAHLHNFSDTITVANSKILQSINKESLKEFLEMNKKNKIYKLNEKIEGFYLEKKFNEIISHLEEFAEFHQLCFDDLNFKSSMYLHLVHSYFNTNQFDKCGYFCRKFLRQIILYLNEQTNVSLSSTEVSTEKNNEENVRNNSGNFTIKKITDLFDFITDLLDLMHKIHTQLIKSVYTSASNSNSNQSNEGTAIIHETIWLMYQLILIFFDNNDFSFKFDTQFKPLKTFMIIFDSMINSPKSERVEFIRSTHDYLAKNGFCSVNNGEFLFWSMNILADYTNNCEFCKQSENSDELQTQVDNNTESSNNDDTEASSSVAENNNKEKNSKSNTKNKSKKANSNSISSGKKSIYCNLCDELCNELIEQNFFCCFGYKTKGVKYIKNHSVIHVKYTLENSVHLFEYFKPELPEYDDLPFKSISSEFNEFLTEIVTLIEEEDEGETLDAIEIKFKNTFQSEEIDEFSNFENLLTNNKNEKFFKDIYYLLGDYNLKFSGKDMKKNQKDALVLKYFIKDLTINTSRFDSWTGLALTISSNTLEEYLENGFNLKVSDEVEEFLKSVYFTINLFRKSIKFLRPSDRLIYIELGSFLYQIHSYCSRQIKINNLTKHFSDASIKITLESKMKMFLNLALDAYKKAVENNSDEINYKIDPIRDESSSYSSSAENQNSVSQEKKVEIKANQIDSNSEEWLNHYMFGKIKEKLHLPSNLMECLEHYKKSFEFLENSGAVHPKRLTYKNKSSSFESSEVFYRIYTVTLKRIQYLTTDTQCLINLLAFLNEIINTKFVKAHNDFQLEELSFFLNKEIFTKSISLSCLENKDILCKCICICIAGLNQILKRFPQHYRSLYRLAHFYSKFLDLNNFEISKNLLLSAPNWNSLIYMPCPGLFHEKNKTCFFNGIWRISNTDFEREGSFFQHLLECVKLLIEVLEKTNDHSNLIELSKSLYQKAEQDRKYLENSSREYLAYFSLVKAFNVLEKIATRKFKISFENLNDLNSYQHDLIPIFLDTFEVYKISSKCYDSLSKNVENLMLKLYVQFHPHSVERINSVTIDEIIKYCQYLERKDKPIRTKSKARNSITQSTVPQ